MATSFESKHSILLKLCWLVKQRIDAEQAFHRAQWQVSYYQKLKIKLEHSKKISKKWNNRVDLTKKIEVTKLMALEKQKQLLDTAERLQKPIIATKDKLDAVIKIEDGQTVGIQYWFINSRGRFNEGQYFDVVQIAEMADQYEAEVALNKLLTE